MSLVSSGWKDVPITLPCPYEDAVPAIRREQFYARSLRARSNGARMKIAGERLVAERRGSHERNLFRGRVGAQKALRRTVTSSRPKRYLLLHVGHVRSGDDHAHARAPRTAYPPARRATIGAAELEAFQPSG